ncbi:MAG: heme-copper oxidase subunit III [Candidatus Marinimicrobia bacterium]|nr:heme-copper oxidase subunit III [Candidatus Neomarinimicrobiota bacterium]
MSNPAATVMNENIGSGQRPLINSTYLAMFIFIGAELMFFSGLIGAFLLLKISAANWPPPGQPTLPVFVTGINTLLLLTSGYFMSRTWSIPKNRTLLLRYMLTASILGGVFLAIQGYEWFRLVGFGLTLQSSVYGGIFYLLIGAHAVHVAGGLIWLLTITILSAKGIVYPNELNKLKACALYWFFVVLLWPFLYILVYF